MGRPFLLSPTVDVTGTRVVSSAERVRARRGPGPMASESSDKTATSEEGWSSVRFTVMYEYPFWVGVLEVETEGNLGAARHIFGVEPTSAEVAEFVRRDFLSLLRQAVGVSVAADATRADTRRASSTRRAARQAAQATSATDISTATQEVLRVQQEAHRKRREAGRETAAHHKRDIEKRKLREKHRGH